jgi:hypothetical protein
MFLFADPFSLAKIITDPHILAHVYRECPDDKYVQLKIYISELTVDSYEYVQVAYVKMPFMIWPRLKWLSLAS